MIRIDEIYRNVFWPWFDRNLPGTRVFFCDPPGDTSPNALFNHGRDDVLENNYIFFHDQEPVWLDLHKPLFDEVRARNTDFDPNTRAHVVVSERGEYVDQLSEHYNWQVHYYFYHGWACLDWFRGYNRTFLFPRAKDRQPSQTFISPNRIVAGKRDHRILFLYNVFKNQLDRNNWISAPRTCVYENIDISTVAQKYCSTYPDILQVFDQADLPKLFPGEDTQVMSSCWLSNFEEAADSLFYVPTETVYFGRRLHVTEKTFKAIAMEMPFILVAPAGTLEYMRSYGFQTFGSVIDESYDEETDDVRRIERVVQLLKDINNLSLQERQKLHQAMLPMVEHNYHHFYGGNFQTMLWQELTAMLANIK